MNGFSRSRPLLLTVGLTLAVAACSSGDAADGGPVVEGEQIGVAGAHEHGVMRVGLAVDGTQVTASVDVTADALFGFEHAPETEEEMATVREAMEQVRAQGGQLVSFAESLSCSAGPVEVLEAPDMDGHSEEDGHDHDEDDHAHDEEGDGHDHDDDHAHDDEEEHDHAEDDHAHDEDEDGHEHEGEVQHSDVSFTIVWTCLATPEGQDAQLTVADVVPGTELVDLTVVTSLGQAGARVEPNAAFRM
ncbi:MAG: DUF2796 domain-containing protein [Gemmatimonadota bacterium]